jgi:SAM-dependent methyltransferase
MMGDGAEEAPDDIGGMIQDDPVVVSDVVAETDWNRLWQALRARRGSSRRDSAFWDDRASSFAEGSAETEYADAFISLVQPEADWTILDMGCGSGTLAVPLSKRVSSVTAVDFSQGMIDVVRARCAEENISTIATIRASWEDDWAGCGIGVHDVAIASRSMVADDMATSILKLAGAARKRVYIVTIVGDGPYDRTLFDALGKDLRRNPDYIYTVNLLYRMGICANVGFITEHRQRVYADIDAAAAGVRWMVGDLGSDKRGKLLGYLQNGRSREDGPLHHVFDIKWAVISWDKER